ncbi:MAG TPA: hypothetical protein VG637_03040, partial [Actinomycetes bacterium]|nr:hypothetical protein [Actinomycetes bacterium]
MARAQPARVGEQLLAPFRVLAGGEDLATAGAALLERACQALEAVEGALLLEGGGFVPGPSWGRPGPAPGGPGDEAAILEQERALGRSQGLAGALEQGG